MQKRLGSRSNEACVCGSYSSYPLPSPPDHPNVPCREQQKLVCIVDMNDEGGVECLCAIHCMHSGG